MELTLEESARRLGAHRWAELRLFEILGAWVASTPEPAAKLLFDRHSAHAAWRAAQWWDRLPVLADVDREALCAATPPMADAYAALAALDATTGRLAGAYRVAMPRLWFGYRRHLAAAGEVAGGAVVRTLGIVTADLSDDWHEGEARLQELLGRHGDTAAAATVVSGLEPLFAAAAPF